MALEKCRDNACLEGFDAHVLSNELNGEAIVVGHCFGTLAFLASHQQQPTNNSYEIETLYYETRWYQLFVHHTPTESRPRASTPPVGAGMPIGLL